MIIEHMTSLAVEGIKLDGAFVTIKGNVIFLEEHKLHSGTRSIIDGILIWSSNIPTIFIYFECMCKLFQKYFVSFRLDQYNFLQDRIDFVGHDLTATKILI